MDNITDDESFDAYLTKLCSDATLQSQKEGFFNNWAEKIQEHLQEEFLNKFESFKTNAERFKSVWNEECVHSLDIQKFFTGKSREISEQRRLEGNKAFQGNDNQKALLLYSQAVLRCPPNDKDFALAFANRSAALFHLQEFDLCLSDICLALKCGYPQHLRYKIYDRRGLCYMKLGLKHEAKEAYRNSIEALGQANLNEAKTESLNADLKRKLKDCEVNQSPDAKHHQRVTGKSHRTHHEPLFNGCSNVLPKASTAVRLNYSPDSGRFMVAAEDIPAGKVLIRESPFSSVLMQEKRGLFCEHCFCRLMAPIPCENCSGVAFCSVTCREKAQGSYHQWECPYLNLFIASGMSLNCYLSLRVITERGLDYFRKISSVVGKKISLPSSSEPHDPQSYMSFYNLVSLESQRHVLDFFKRSLMSVFLLKVLQNANFFGPRALTDPDTLNEDELLIGSLLLQHLQMIQFNAHEVSGICFQEELAFKKCKSVYLGLALYPTVCFCNHSCYPAVGRYFDGKEMTIVNLRPLKAGEMIAENYGPIFTHNSKEDRQKKLWSRYWFRCSCEACVNDWPKYINMSNIIQLREEAENLSAELKQLNTNEPTKKNKKKKKQNENTLNGDTNIAHKNKEGEGVQTEEFESGSTKNVFEAHKDFSLGFSLMEKFKREEAIAAYTRWVDVAAHKVHLPLKDLHLALEALRLLVAARGTHYLIPKT